MKSDRKATQPGRTSFPRTARLLKPIEFKKVFKKNVVSSDRFFRVLARLNNGPCSRLGMAVSRQVDKRAVERNRFKRVIRESFRHTWAITGEEVRNSEQNIKNRGGFHHCVDLLVLPRRECASICNKQLFLSLEDHWLRINKALERQKEPAGQQAPRPGITRAKQDAGTI
jgi:ribonuclease P protein component